jgi:hypothetical protein
MEVVHLIKVYCICVWKYHSKTSLYKYLGSKKIRLSHTNTGREKSRKSKIKSELFNKTNLKGQIFMIIGKKKI